jgi:hypothetical protein
MQVGRCGRNLYRILPFIKHGRCRLLIYMKVIVGKDSRTYIRMLGESRNEIEMLGSKGMDNSIYVYLGLTFGHII